MIARSGYGCRTIALRLGINPMTMHDWVSGKNVPEPESFPKLAAIEAFLGLPPATLTERVRPTRRAAAPAARPFGPFSLRQRGGLKTRRDRLAYDTADTLLQDPRYAEMLEGLRPAVQRVLAEDLARAGLRLEEHGFGASEGSGPWPHGIRREMDDLLAFKTRRLVPQGMIRSGPLWKGAATQQHNEGKIGRFLGFLASPYNEVCPIDGEDLTIALLLLPSPVA